MKMKSRKFLTLLLALALVLAMAAPAFAAWSSFQRNNVNNGRLIAAPLDANSTYSVTLPGESNASGVNTTPVINGSIAYTLYDGGAYSGNDGGARLSSVNMTTHSSNWNIQLDAAAGGSQQLSTPCLDTSGNGTLYAGMTHYTNELTSTGVTGWRYADNTPVSSFNFPSGATTIYYDGLVTPSDYYQPQLASNMIVPSGLNITGTLTLTDTSTSATYTLTGSGYEGYNFTLYNSSPSTLIPESTYDLELTITNDQALTGWTTLQYLVSNWKIYKVTDLTTTHSKSELTNGSGYGQINTHINKDSGNLYFGIYEGDRCFYQYNLSTSALTDFTPTGGEDFYWAGAAVCDKYDSVVFGSESGKVYMRPKGTDFGDLNEGDEITLPSAGNIRSSICYPGGYFYCTSKGGFVWQIATDLSSATAVDIKGGVYTASSSTPVKSDNDIVYVGCYSTSWPYTGAVKGVPAGNDFNVVNLFDIYTGDAVQSSVTAYSDTINLIDRVYFTTNSSPGAGYCYSVDPFSTPVAVAQVWSEAADNYTLQGTVAEDNGYMAFGDNADYATNDCKLYIVEP